MRSNLFRLAVVATLVAAVASCDSTVPFRPNDSGQNGGGTTVDPTDQTPPSIQLDTPATGMSLYLGDSVAVRIQASDGYGLKQVIIWAQGVRQLPGATAVDTVVYVAPVGINIAGDRTVNLAGWVFPQVPADTNLLRVVFHAQAVDQNNNVTNANPQIVTIVRAPTVTVEAPLEGELVRAGATQDVTVRASSSVGLRNIGFEAYSQGTGWSPPIAARDSVTVTGNDTVWTLSFLVPVTAPANGQITIVGFATDLAGRRRVSPPRTVMVRAAAAGAPIVNQTVGPRLEIDDSITVVVDGADVTTIGAVVHSTAGAPPDTLLSYTVAQLGLPVFTGKKTIQLPLSLGPTWQGRQVTITSFARDQLGRTGWSTTSTVTPQTDSVLGVPSVATVVYGRTFSLPLRGVAGDLAVDTLRGRAFVSNTQYNRLEVWSADRQSFTPNGVAVGSQPWGMAIANDQNTLLVANSGGTNISRVPIAGADPTTLREDLNLRIRTRNTVLYVATFSVDAQTRTRRWAVSGPFSYSDRPQYVAQSAAGRVYFSTKPTTTSPAGTLRYIDPTQPYPDPRTIYDYGKPSGPDVFTIFNADFVASTGFPPGMPVDDTLFIADHRTGTADPDASIGSASTFIPTAVNDVNALGGDVEYANVDIGSLALTDTTYIATSGNRNWIAFGEGNKPGVARAMLTYDSSAAVVRPFFSPGLAVADLMDNASEPVFGLGLDFTGATLGVHGRESHFSTVTLPFHLRLQGKYNSFDTGAGISFHPYADGNNLADASSRLAFVASANGQIEIVDIAYFINRGSLPIRSNFYGPLRVSAPFPGERARGVILKLFGLTGSGLVVIDVTDADIKPGP